MKRFVIGCAILGVVLAGLLQTPAISQGFEEPSIAEIRLFGGNFAPDGWMFCEGQELPIAPNQALFSILGVTYGGNGTTVFQLPDLRDSEKLLKSSTSKTKNTPRYIIAMKGMYPQRP